MFCLGLQQSMERAAGKAEKMVKQENGEREEREDNDGCGNGMSRGHPRKPNGEQVFAET